MANIDLSIGQVNITSGYLIFIARKVSTPSVEEARRVFPTPLPASFNVILPEVGEIDPVNYFVDAYESVDGVSLDLLLTTFVVNARNNIVISETRYYKVGNGGLNPEPDQPLLIDAYLDGKTFSAVYKDGAGRPLVPPPYNFKEYDPYPGGGIELLNGILFSSEEIVAIEISYLAEQTQGTSQGGLYNGVVSITADTTLDSTHRNKRLRCASGSLTTLVITLEDVASVPEGAFYHFTCNDGNQLQVRILAASGVLLNKTNYTEISISPGEYVRIEKTGTYWEATMAHDGILQVGERFSGTWKDHPNTIPEDGRLLDGDEYPRLWWWLSNKLPANQKIITDSVTNPGYTHPTDKLGLFVVHSTLKKFRMPNTQNISERGLKDFDSYNADAQRLYDYPGGVQNESVGPANIRTVSFTGVGITKNGVVNPGIGFLATQGDGGLIASDTAAGTNNNSARTLTFSIISPAGENRAKNFGVVYLRRI